MQRKTMLAWPVVCALAIAACSGAPQTLLSPTGVSPDSSAVNPDGSTLKATAPRDLGPSNGAVVNTLRPTLSFTNPAGRYATVGFAYDIEVQNASGTVVYQRTIGESGTSSSHALDTELTYSDNFWWRSRARLGNEVGPWADFAQFRTLDRPAPVGPPPTTPSTGGLPFAVPDVCRAGNGAACVSVMTGVSPWWPDCRGGSGTGCHRFARSVAAAMATGDSNWGLISKNPGEQQCTWNGCGSGSGNGYGEDVVAYHTGGGNWIGYDIVGGAGAPGASANWSQLTSRRPGNDWRPVPLPLGVD